jgi:hypothetical protein
VKKTILLLITFAIANYAFAQNVSTDDSLQTNKNFYITPSLGISTLVGAYGIEFQYKNYGYNIGLTFVSEEIGPFTTLSGGIRYYFNPSHHSWVISVGGGVVLDDLKPDDNLCLPGDDDCEEGTVTDMYIGAIIGYRWTWGNKLHLNIGLGPNYIKWQKIKEGEKYGDFLMYDLVLGYTFNK